MTPDHLLTALRVLNIRVRAEGDLVRCKAPSGALIPSDLADQIRTLKPQLLGLLREEDAAIAWRVASGLLTEPVTARPVGACAYCGAKMPGKQTGRCVLCCLAAAQVFEARAPKTQATYPRLAIAPDDRLAENGSRDMSPERTTEAA